MAKQTFTTGQVLTAAQMTSLQQTAMLGGDASVKTASYVLVAADAGTTVAMYAAGSTTITVNTGLFSAGDIVFIQNRGAGNCTVTAGTATVSTAGSLILPQNDAGILYFTSASAAIFYDFIQTGAVSPLTTKGDLYTYSTSDARLPVGTNGYTLVADSAEATGLKWAAASSGGITLLSTTNLSGATTTISSISGSYKNLIILIKDFYASSNFDIIMGVNGNNTGSNYQQVVVRAFATTVSTYADNTTAGAQVVGYQMINTQQDNFAVVTIADYANATTQKTINILSSGTTSASASCVTNTTCAYRGTVAAITEINVKTLNGTWSAGSVEIYGVN